MCEFCPEIEFEIFADSQNVHGCQNDFLDQQE